MKPILNKLFAHESLDKSQAREVLVNISEGSYNPAQVAVFMGVYMMRSVTVHELCGFRDALLDLCLDPGLECGQSIDLCGTGGDGKNTFNISTCSAFVVAGAGYRVSKHGNYGVSSLCGSSNVLEWLGYRFSDTPDKLQKELDVCGICFLHAPLFHPAMKFVAPIRKELGVKTFFNMLGPLVNPVRPTHQSVGVFDLELARLYKYLFEEGQQSYTIIHALDGYDEVSLTADSLVISNSSEDILDAEDFGLRSCTPESLHGGDSIQEAGRILVDVLENRAPEEHTNAVLANSALAIRCFEPHWSLEQCTAKARESLESDAAKNILHRLLKIQEN